MYAPFPHIVVAVSACLLSAAPAQNAAKVRSSGDESERQAASMFFYSQTDNSVEVYGFMELTYGSAPWKDEYADALENAKPGQRFRIGSNFWATFDSNIAFEADGKTLAAGAYYLALEITAAGEASLVFLDPVETRKHKTYPFQTDRTKGGTLAKLEWKENEQLAKTLKVSLLAEDSEHPEKVALILRFGHQELRLALTAKLETKPAGR